MTQIKTFSTELIDVLKQDSLGKRIDVLVRDLARYASILSPSLVEDADQRENLRAMRERIAAVVPLVTNAESDFHETASRETWYAWSPLRSLDRDQPPWWEFGANVISARLAADVAEAVLSEVPSSPALISTRQAQQVAEAAFDSLLKSYEDFLCVRHGVLLAVRKQLFMGFVRARLAPMIKRLQELRERLGIDTAPGALDLGEPSGTGEQLSKVDEAAPPQPADAAAQDNEPVRHTVKAAFPKRAAWLTAEMAKRSMTPYSLHKAGGPDPKTIKRILDGVPVREAKLVLIVNGLSHANDPVRLDDIPSE